MTLDPLLLLPPEGADARLWAPVLTGLGVAGPVMVAPVHGAERIEDIASALVTAAPARFALCGMGLGGMVAMDIYRRAPHRVSRIALLDTSPHADTPQEAAAREAQIIQAKTGQLAEAVAADLRAAGLAEGPHQRDVLALAADMADHLGPQGYVRQMRCLMRRRDQQATLRRMACPALVLCGAHNRRYPVKRHHSMAELIPTATLQVIEQAGHLSPLEAPETVIAALQTWQAAPLTAR